MVTIPMDGRSDKAAFPLDSAQLTKAVEIK